MARRDATPSGEIYGSTEKEVDRGIGGGGGEGLYCGQMEQPRAGELRQSVLARRPSRRYKWEKDER